MDDYISRQDAPDINVGDIISRQAALDVIRFLQTYKLFGDEIILVDKAEVQTELMMLPSAQPEIIRCKGCKNFRRWIDTDITFCDLTDGIVCKDDFCSRAERRPDE